jgi:hypothetical protein
MFVSNSSLSGIYYLKDGKPFLANYANWPDRQKFEKYSFGETAYVKKFNIKWIQGTLDATNPPPKIN